MPRRTVVNGGGGGRRRRDRDDDDEADDAGTTRHPTPDELDEIADRADPAPSPEPETDLPVRDTGDGLLDVRRPDPTERRPVDRGPETDPGPMTGPLDSPADGLSLEDRVGPGATQADIEQAQKEHAAAHFEGFGTDDVVITDGQARLRDDVIARHAAEEWGVDPRHVEVIDGHPRLTPEGERALAEQQVADDLRGVGADEVTVREERPGFQAAGPSGDMLDVDMPDPSAARWEVDLAGPAEDRLRDQQIAEFQREVAADLDVRPSEVQIDVDDATGEVQAWVDTPDGSAVERWIDDAAEWWHHGATAAGDRVAGIFPGGEIGAPTMGPTHAPTGAGVRSDRFLGGGVEGLGQLFNVPGVAGAVIEQEQAGLDARRDSLEELATGDFDGPGGMLSPFAGAFAPPGLTPHDQERRETAAHAARMAPGVIGPALEQEPARTTGRGAGMILGGLLAPGAAVRGGRWLGRRRPRREPEMMDLDGLGYIHFRSPQRQVQRGDRSDTPTTIGADDLAPTRATADPTRGGRFPQGAQGAGPRTGPDPRSAAVEPHGGGVAGGWRTAEAELARGGQRHVTAAGSPPGLGIELPPGMATGAGVLGAGAAPSIPAEEWQQPTIGRELWQQPAIAREEWQLPGVFGAGVGATAAEAQPGAEGLAAPMPSITQEEILAGAVDAARPTGAPPDVLARQAAAQTEDPFLGPGALQLQGQPLRTTTTTATTPTVATDPVGGFLTPVGRPPRRPVAPLPGWRRGDGAGFGPPLAAFDDEWERPVADPAEVLAGGPFGGAETAPEPILPGDGGGPTAPPTPTDVGPAPRDDPGPPSFDDDFGTAGAARDRGGFDPSAAFGTAGGGPDFGTAGGGGRRSPEPPSFDGGPFGGGGSSSSPFDGDGPFSGGGPFDDDGPFSDGGPFDDGPFSDGPFG